MVGVAAAAGEGVLAGARGGSAVFLVGAVTWRLRHDRDITRGPWVLVALGGSLALISAFTRLIHGALIDESSPFPSPAEIPGLVGYLLIILACRSFWKHRSTRSDAEAALDGFLVAAAAAVVVFTALLSDYIRDSTIDPWARTGNVVYTVMDIALIGFAARLAIGPGVRNVPWRLVAGAALLILANDLFFLLETTGSAWGGTVASVTSPVAFTLAAAAILHPNVGALTEAPAYRSPKLTTGRLAMLAAALLTLPAALLSALVRDTAPDLPVLVTGSVVLALLSLMRISLLFRAKERIAGLDTALTESGRALLDASTATEIAVAVSRTIRLVVDEETRYAAVVRGAKTHHLVVRAIPEQTAAIEPLPADTPDPDLHDLLCVTPGSSGLIELDLGERAQFGRILVEIQRPLEDAHHLALQTMSAQITQALASLRLAEARFARRAEQRLTALVEQSADLVTVVDENGSTIFASPNAERILGVPSASLIGTDLRELVHPDDIQMVSAQIERPSRPSQVRLPSKRGCEPNRRSTGGSTSLPATSPRIPRSAAP